jgi:hypothetical protein
MASRKSTSKMSKDVTTIDTRRSRDESNVTSSNMGKMEKIAEFIARSNRRMPRKQFRRRHRVENKVPSLTYGHFNQDEFSKDHMDHLFK